MKILLTLSVSVLLINTASAVLCYQCSSLDDKNCVDLQGLTEKVCSNNEDVCIKIVTEIEQPNNGPQDRMVDNMRTTYVSRYCAAKKTFTHFADVDEACDRTFVGGGGEQQRCICSGNGCNAASHLKIGVVTILLSAVALFVM